MLKQNRTAGLVALSAASMLLAGAVLAADLRLGTKLDLESLDPHFSTTISGESSHLYIYDRLVNTDADLNLTPGLATSWTLIDELTWEFTLREGVTFHDGSTFDAEDVAAVVRRIPSIPNSPSPFTSTVRDIARVEILTPTTVRFHTSVPSPTLPRKMTNVYIIPSEMEGAPTQAFNDGTAAIGTGPYKLVKWSPGQSLELVRNDAYWGETPSWERVTELVLANDGARTAAILSGDVQVITYVPVEDLPTFQGSSKYAVFSGALARMHYVAIDSARDESPYARGPNGENPLRDVRVRRALSLAIDRAAIVDRLQQGVGEPAGQVLPLSMKGGPGIPAPAPDPEAAKALLAEAGYGSRLSLTLHATNDRYPGDVEIAQAIAQMWARIGVDVSVETLARTIFFPKASDFEFSIFSAQYADDTNNVMSRSMLRSRDADKGLGSGNRGRYSNPEVDALIDAASIEFDEEKAAALTEQAIRIAMEDQALIPVFFPGFTVATTAGLTTQVRLDGRFNAMMVRPE